MCARSCTTDGNELDPQTPCAGCVDGANRNTEALCTADGFNWNEFRCSEVADNPETLEAFCTIVHSTVVSKGYTCCPKGSTDDPCFPSTATVTKADGTLSRLDAIEAGDAIVAATAEGILTTATVSSLSTAKSDAEATFLELKLTSGKSVTLTPEHHLPVGDECCSHLKMAKDVYVGERVWAARGPTVVADTIATISATIEVGLPSSFPTISPPSASPYHLPTISPPPPHHLP